MNETPQPEFGIHCHYDSLLLLDELKPHPKNPNRHSDKQLALYAKVISKAGWRRPIVVSKRSGFIVRGHGALGAAKKNGWTLAPVEFQDYDSDESEIADMIADNRLAELAELDLAAVKGILLELPESFDLELTAFDVKEIENLLAMPEIKAHITDAAEAPVFDGDGQLYSPSHIRMVQLYFDEKNIAEFLGNVEVLKQRYGKENMTDAVFCGVAELASQHA